MLETTSLQTSLADQWELYRRSNPKIRIREAARELGVSEAQLVATRCGRGNIRLQTDFSDMLHALAPLGHCLAITRSDAVVHETQGVYDNVRFHGSVGMFFRPGVDTRFFIDKWASAFAVNEEGRLSLQFFDVYGVAAHKVYVTDRTNKNAYWEFVHRFRADDQSSKLDVLEKKAGKTAGDKKEINVTELCDAWRSIKDVHEGNAIIKSNGGDHQKIYQALGHEFALPLKTQAVEVLIERLAKNGVETLIFAMNECAVQAYGGPIKEILRTGPWFNILDPEFNLHVKTVDIGAAWLIQKPSDDGWITTMDVFDHQGREIMLLADNRGRGETEKGQWTDILKEVAGEFSAVIIN